MGTLRLRRPAPMLERGLYIGSGEVLGVDLDDRPVIFDDAIVVLDLARIEWGWLLRYRTLGAYASGAVNSRIRPVAS